MRGRARRPWPLTRQLLLLQVAVLVAVVGAGFGVVAWQWHRGLEHQYEQRALTAARAIAREPGLAADVADRDQPAVQRLALSAQRATHALFVVVTDIHGIRLAHPDPARIGERVSTSPDAVLRGAEVADVARGTLGLSARGKVPLRTADGRIVGEVSVGIAAGEISGSLHRLLWTTGGFLLAALLLGSGLVYLLMRLLKRRTFGLEPADLAELVREREAMLRGVSDGVVTLDAQGRVTNANAEARRLLDLELSVGEPLRDAPPALVAAMDDSGRARVVVTPTRVLVTRHRAVERDGRRLGSVLTIFDRTELEALTDELAAVRTMTTALRAQRHEFANRLHTVHGLLRGGTNAEAAEYVAALLDAPAVTLAHDSEVIGSSTLRALLGGKVAEAAEAGVALTLSDTSWAPQKLRAPVEVVTVVGNLLGNAIEAARAGAQQPALPGGQVPAVVEVDLLSDGDALVVSVSNTGAPVERPDALFAAGVSSRGADRGLGLAIARSTARALGGDVELRCSGAGGHPIVFGARLPGVLAVEAEADVEVDVEVEKTVLS